MNNKERTYNMLDGLPVPDWANMTPEWWEANKHRFTWVYHPIVWQEEPPEDDDEVLRLLLGIRS